MTPRLSQITRLTMLRVMLAAFACATPLLTAANASAALPPIKHVFVLIDENESESTTFGPAQPAPYLSQTLTSEGAFLPNYYGIGHASLDNYIAMVSGQAPNPLTSGDCPNFINFPADSMDSSGQENGEGCVYPADVPTLMGQLDGAGLTWRAYEDGMGVDPARDNTVSGACGHPVVGTADGTEAGESSAPFDEYATRHDPFVYFHSVIDNASECDANVVNLSQLPTDLASAATTPNYVFITPNLCNDGHDTPCPDKVGAGGLTQADSFLQTWVPQITSSPAFKQNGLLIITFDEAVGDATDCCGEIPGPDEPLPGGTGPGGGDVGAVLLSPYIAPGTMSSTPYNHYSMLGTIEDLFGLPRLADAVGTTAFGSDVFTATAPRDSGLKLKPGSFAPKSSGKSRKHRGTTIDYSDSEAGVTKLTVERVAGGYRLGHRACKALKPGRHRPKHSKACTSTTTIGSFTHHDRAGANRIGFTGRLHGHTLAAGAYVLKATPTLGTLTGKPISTRFHIV